MHHLSPVEIVHLNKFKPMDHQVPLFDALFNKGYKRILQIWHRRAGKDVASWNAIIRAALTKVGVYFYCAPTYSQGRRIIWDSILNNGMKFMDFIPPSLIERTNEQQMKIHLVNGSMIQIIGSDAYDQSLVGSNPQGIVFTEWALADDRAYQYARPILTANDGWAIFISTPRGKQNHLWQMYNIAMHSAEWYCTVLTVEDTGIIDMDSIEKEKLDGMMSEDLIRQEYYCDFSVGQDSTMYGKYMDKLRLNGQIGIVPWEIGFPVMTFWDIGVRDSTFIIFAQIIGQTIRVIETYENQKKGLEHYVQYVFSKPYQYSKHVAPHDMKVTEFGSGISRIDKARQLGMQFILAPNIPLFDGIEVVRSTFPKLWIDEKNAAGLIKALENYRQEYDPIHKIFKTTPLHDWSSHAADAIRYMCISLGKIKQGSTPESLEQSYREAQTMMGGSTLPAPFRQPDSYY